MRLTCHRADLVGAVSTVERAVGTRETTQVLGGIHMVARDGRLQLSATDLELAMTCQIGANVEVDGAVVLDARYFSQIVRKMPGEELSLNLLEDGRVQVQAERVEYALRSLPAEEYPRVDPVKEGVQLTVPQGLLRTMIRQTAFSAATDDSRPYLTGVLVEVEGDELRLVASDSNRLAYRQARLESPVPQGARAILPARALNELMRILHDDEEKVTAVIGQSGAGFAAGSTQLITRLIEGQFPNYRHVFPQRESIVIFASRLALIDCLERAGLLSRRGPAVATLAVSGGTLTVRAREADVGQVVEVLDVRQEGEDGQNAYQVRFLLEALKALDSEEVRLGLNEGDRQATIRVPGDEDFLYILMPVRLS